MEKNKGFVSIIVLTVMYVLIVMGLYLDYKARLEYLILNSTSNNIQSYYLSEGKVIMSIHEEKYYSNQLYPILIDVFRNNRFSTKKKYIKIENEDLYLDDNLNIVNISFTDKNNRKQLILNSESNYKGLISKVVASGTLVNELFEIQYPVLDANTLSNKYEEDFRVLLDKISDEISVKDYTEANNIYAREFLNFDYIYLNTESANKYKITAYKNSLDSPDIESFHNQDIFLICRNNNDNRISLFLGDPENQIEDIRLFGIIFVEGDLILSSNFEFNGIIIVKDGEIIINSPNRPKIYGLVILDNVHNCNEFVNNADIIYNNRNIYIYGTYLPGFLESKINLIKCN